MLAYIDSFSGLVPCKVLYISEPDEYGGHYIKVKVTASRNGYKRGTVETFTGRIIVPRDAVYLRCHQYRIRPYSWSNYRVT